MEDGNKKADYYATRLPELFRRDIVAAYEMGRVGVQLHQMGMHNLENRLVDSGNAYLAVVSPKLVALGEALDKLAASGTDLPNLDDDAEPAVPTVTVPDTVPQEWTV